MSLRVRLGLVVVVLSAGVALVVGTAALGGGRPLCFEHRATIVGTSASETIDGTSNDDVIVGKNGDDEIHGNGGQDRICGGDGEDDLTGDDGKDFVSGGPDNDTVEGNVGSDTLNGGRGDDTVGSPDICGGNCQQHPNVIDGGKGTDTCWTGQLDKVRRCEDTPNDNFNSIPIG